MRESNEQRLSDIAASFARIASCIHEDQPDSVLRAACEETETLCTAAAPESPGEVGPLLINVTTALQTWRQVWPRLGQQREFRLAVAREAALWSKRLQEFAAAARGLDPRGGAGGG